MRKVNIQGLLFIIWLLPFLYCFSIPLLLSSEIPNLYWKMIDEVVDTFLPQIGIMTGFYFSDMFKEKKPVQLKETRTLLALLLSIIYVGIFVIIMIVFHSDNMTAVKAISLYSGIRIKISVLVSALMAFYFASRE